MSGVLERTRVDPKIRTLGWIAGLAGMVVVLIWSTQQSAPVPWLPITVGVLIAMISLGFLAPMGWGRLLVRVAGVATLALGMTALGSYGISLVVAGTVLLLSSRAPQPAETRVPMFERTRSDRGLRRRIWGGVLALLMLVLVVAIREHAEGTVDGEGQPQIGALVALGVLVFLGGLALLEPMGWGRFMMRAIAVGAVALLFTGLAILYLPLIVAALILLLSSRGPGAPHASASP